MQLLFNDYVLDTRRGELRLNAEVQSLEPRAFSLLCLLAENHDRLVSKDEILEKVWDGRIVTDSAIATVIKTARKALGDDGEAQKYLKTVRGRGFRFVAPVRVRSEDSAPFPAVTAEAVNPGPPTERPAFSDRPSIAILPFSQTGSSDKFSAFGDALPAELISSLSRLRWLRVIARGSSFRFRSPDPDAVRAALNVDYCMSGTIEIAQRKLAILVDLTDTNSHELVWSSRFESTVDDIHEIRAQIIHAVIAAMELHVPLNEAEKARVRSPDALDAWGEYHIGLQHMYRFNRADNEIAAAHFARATKADPGFARAYAALSFTSFQNVFLKYSADPATDFAAAQGFAERSLELDALDPFGNFNLARTYWLAGDPDGGREMLGRALQINPNYAQGHYALAYTDAMAGRGASGLENISAAISLSPLDPLLYAMRATRGFTHLVQSDYVNAAEWAERGARSPASHFLIGAIAAAAHHLNGDQARAGYWANNVLSRRPDTSIEHFFSAFPFTDGRVRTEITEALSAQGFRQRADS